MIWNGKRKGERQRKGKGRKGGSNIFEREREAERESMGRNG